MKLSELCKTVYNIAQDRPNVYYRNEESCQYSSGLCSDGTIGCLIGQAAKELGEPIDDAKINKAKYGDKCGKCGVSIDLAAKLLKIEDDMGQFDGLKWLQKVQQNQDEGFSWKDSIDASKHLFPMEV